MKPLRPPNLSMRDRFTLIELLVVIAIIAVLASMLLPALTKSKEKARQVACASNQKQLGLAMRMYVDDSDSWYPMATATWGPWNAWTWDDALAGYDGRPSKDIATDDRRWFDFQFGYTSSTDLYRCPEEDTRHADNGTALRNAMRRSYAMNSGGLSWGFGDVKGVGTWGDYIRGIGRRNRSQPDSKVPDTSGTILISEIRDDDGEENVVSGGNSGNRSYIDSPWSQQDGTYTQLPWHQGGNRWNYLFCDGHVASLDPRNTIGDGTFGEAPQWPLGLNMPEGMWTRTPGD